MSWLVRAIGPKFRQRQTDSVQGFMAKVKVYSIHKYIYIGLQAGRVSSLKTVQTGKQIQRGHTGNPKCKRSGRGSQQAGTKFQTPGFLMRKGGTGEQVGEEGQVT